MPLSRLFMWVGCVSLGARTGLKQGTQTAQHRDSALAGVELSPAAS